MPPTKPPENECEQFRELVESTKEPEVKKYIERAYWAFCDGYLEAAVLLAWAGIEKFCSLVIEHVGRWYFEYYFDEQWPKRRDSKTNAIAFAKVSSRTRLFRSIFNEDKSELEKKEEFFRKVKAIENLETVRHQYAHGTGNFASDSNEVLLLIKNAEFVFKKGKEDEKFENPEKVHDFLCQYPNEIEDFEGFICHFPTGRALVNICIKLCRAVLEDKIASYINLQKFISQAFDKLNPQEKEMIWMSYAKDAVSKVIEEAPDVVTNIQVISLLPYPDRRDELQPRDELLRAAFVFLENENKRITDFLLVSSSPDNPPEAIVDDQIRIVKLAKQLDHKVPPDLSDEWQPVYRKCMAGLYA